MATKKHEHDEPKAAKAEPDPGLVVMVKDGEELAVHPTCVDSHVKAGWKRKD